MNFLIIEDEILVQSSLKKILESKGANVTITASGTEALKIIESQNFDRIICDLMLTDITGFDVIEGSKKLFSGQEIRTKFVIITAYSSDQIVSRARQYGCPIIFKPFTDINEAIDTFMNKGNHYDRSSRSL